MEVEAVVTVSGAACGGETGCASTPVWAVEVWAAAGNPLGSCWAIAMWASSTRARITHCHMGITETPLFPVTPTDWLAGRNSSLSLCLCGTSWADVLLWG